MVSPYGQSDPFYTQMSGDQYPQFLPFDGLPGGPVAQQLMGMIGAVGMSNAGMMPMGMNNRYGSLHNNIQYQMFSQAHMASLQAAARNDMRTLMDTERGFFNGFGMNIDPNTRNNLEALNKAVVSGQTVLPLSIVDALHGGRSALSLTSSIHVGGLGRRDAVTGFDGMSGNTSAQIASDLYHKYYSSPDWARKTAGLNSREMGGLFEELSQRGMMPDVGSERQRVVAGLMAARNAGKDVSGILQSAGVNPNNFNNQSLMSGLTDGDISSLIKNQDVQTGMRSADSSRIDATLKKYMGAIAAVKEIFGAHGKNDAAFPELFAALEELTQGASSQLDGGRMELGVRNMWNLAQRAKVDMQTVHNMMTVAGQQTDAMGKSSLFAPQMVSSGLAFMAAYERAGLGATPAWGLQNREQMAGSHMAAYGRAVNSDLGNRMGALLRLGEQVGGLSGASAAMFNDLKNGTMHPSLANQSYAEFVTQLQKDTGLSRYEIESAVGATKSNEEFIHKYNLGGTISQIAQPHEFKTKILGRSFKNTAAASLKRIMGGSGNYSGVADRMGDVMTAGLFSMDQELRRNGTARNVSIATEFEKYLADTAARDPNSEEAKIYRQLNTLGGVEKERSLMAMAETMYGNANENYQKRHGGEALESAITRMGGGARGANAAITAQVALKSALEQINAGSGTSGGPVMAFVNALQKQGGGKATTKGDIVAALIGAATGGKLKSELAEELSADLMRLKTGEEELKALESDENAKMAGRDPAYAKQWAEQMGAKREAIIKMQTKIRSFMQANKLDEVFGMNSGKDGKDLSLNVGTMTIESKDIVVTIKDSKGKGPAKPEGRGQGPVV